MASVPAEGDETERSRGLVNRYLDRNPYFIPLMTGVLLPVAVLLAGSLISSRIEDSKLDSEYVRVALSILSTKPTGKSEGGGPPTPTEDELALRRWAMRLLNSRSPEKFKGDEMTALLKGAASLSTAVVVDGHERVLRYESGNPRTSWTWLTNPGYTVLVRPGQEQPVAVLNLPIPESLEFDSAHLSVTILALPSTSLAVLKRKDGAKLAVGDVLAFADFAQVRIFDQSSGRGGRDFVAYEVRDPIGRDVSVTLNLMLNPEPER